MTMLNAEIQILEGAAAGKKFRVSGNETTIGRGSQNGISLPNYPRLSRAHAKLTFVHGAYKIEDLGSAHGMEIDGRRVKEAEIQDGDVVRLADCAFRFNLAPAKAKAVRSDRFANRSL